MGADDSGKRSIKSHKRASQTGSCGSVLVCNANKGTLELKKKDTGNYLTIKCCKLFASVALWRTLWMLRANFVAPNKVVFIASYNYSKSGLVNKLKLFSRMSTTRAKISLRNQGTLLV